MKLTRCIEHVETARDEAEAAEMVAGMIEQDGSLGARVIGGNGRPFSAQGFFDAGAVILDELKAAEDAGGRSVLPDGSHVRLVPAAILEACQPTAKSAGHVAFVDGFEWFTVGTELFRAPIGNVIDTSGHRSGRWESSLEHARRFPTIFPFLEPAADVTSAAAQQTLKLTSTGGIRE